MSEKRHGLFQLSSNAPLQVDFQGSRITPDGGLILVRELDERLGFGEIIAQHPADPVRNSGLCRIWTRLRSRCSVSGRTAPTTAIAACPALGLITLWLTHGGLLAGRFWARAQG